MKTMTIKGNYSVKVAEIVVKRASKKNFDILMNSIELIDSEFVEFKEHLTTRSKYSSKSFYNIIYLVGQFYFDYGFDMPKRNKGFDLYISLLENYTEI
jgi:hypothetical protein